MSSSNSSIDNIRRNSRPSSTIEDIIRRCPFYMRETTQSYRGICLGQQIIRGDLRDSFHVIDLRIKNQHLTSYFIMIKSSDETRDGIKTNRSSRSDIDHHAIIIRIDPHTPPAGDGKGLHPRPDIQAPLHHGALDGRLVELHGIVGRVVVVDDDVLARNDISRVRVGDGEAQPLDVLAMSRRRR